VNVSALDSTVSNNKTSIDGVKATHTTGNDVAGSFGQASGVNVAAQNVGSSSLVNQNVNVQANMGGSGSAQ